MLIVIVYLFLHYVLGSCVIYEKILKYIPTTKTLRRTRRHKHETPHNTHNVSSSSNVNRKNFNEDLLIKRHHQNFHQIKTFIKDARHRFKEDRSVEDLKPKTTRNEKPLDTNWWWDNSSFIGQLGLTTPQNFLLPLQRSRPSFPISITPYTTELNDHHLSWNEIFPDQNIGQERTSKQSNQSLLQSPRRKDQNSSGSFLRPPIVEKRSRASIFNTSFSPDTVTRNHSAEDSDLTTVFITRNADYMMWLHEITTYTPVERWLQNLADRVTPSYGYTTTRFTHISRAVMKTKTSIQNRQLQKNSTDQPSRILRQGTLLLDTSPDAEVNRIEGTTKARFFIEDVDGILHLRTIPEEDEQTRMLISGRPATISENAYMKVTPTTAREQHPETSRLASRKSRRFPLKARKRKRYHHSHQQKRPRKRRKHRDRHTKYIDDIRNYKQEVDYPMLRRMRETRDVSRRFSLKENKQHLKAFFSNEVTRSTKTINLREPTYLPKSKFLSKLNKPRHEKRDIEAQPKNPTSMEKTSIYHQVKESLKAVEKKKKEKRLKIKAELIKKIVEGSSYSYGDGEETLRKNLVGALRYGRR